jgi:peptidoglycan/xylan/chitin deacetylase (PgdA/CDA1 family)
VDTTEKDALEQQRLRRQRVNRMKNGIVLTISLWMILSLLAIIILSVQVIRLNNRLERLEIRNTIVTDTDTDTETQASTELEPEVQETDSGIDLSHVVTGIDTEDNMAGPEDSHQVYLTFDCVPGANTQAILDVLAAYDVKATFFVSAVDSDEAREACRRIVEEGHTLGMHSYSNQYSTIYASTDAFYEDYEAISQYLYDATGVRSSYYRFLGGSGNEISNVNMAELVHILNGEGITFYDWNVSAGDAAADCTADQVVANVLEGVSQYKTSVVLLHDDEDKSTTADALWNLIPGLRDMGAEILPIDENTNTIQYIKADSVE